MRRHRKSVWTNSITSVTIAVFCGILFIFFTVLLLSAVMYYILSDMRVAKIFSILAVCLGTYASTYLCGKYHRKKGLAEGFISGMFIYIFFAIFGIVFFNEFIGIKKLLLFALSGAVGGVTGVNSKRPKNFTE